MSVDLLFRPQPTAPEPIHGRRSRTAGVTFAAVAAVGAVVALVLVARPHAAQELPGRVLVATLAPGATSADLSALEARLVGAQAVADPATGRLPDVRAFHRAGITSMRAGSAVLTVRFLPDATAAQVDRVRAQVLSAPTVIRLRDGVDLAGVQEQLDAATAGGPPGVAMTVSTPYGVWAGAAGVADLTAGRPMTTGLQYRIGGTTDTLTAVVVLQLVGEGRLQLDQPVSTYLPGLLPYPQPFTVRQLLSHSNGPADDTHFDVAGTLSRLVESITRHPMAQEYARRILAPLGMAHTFVARDARFPAPFVRGYTQDAAGVRFDATSDLALGRPGTGGVVSTAADMAVFFQALLGGRLLPASLLAQMTTATAESVIARMPYGLGLQRYATPCGASAVGHSGAIGGYLSDVYASENGSTVVVYLQNALGAAALGELPDRLSGVAFCTAPVDH